MKAIREAGDEEVHLLLDGELTKLFEKTNFSNIHEAQRYNMVIFGFCCGLRPETLQSLTLNMLKLTKDEKGREVLTTHISHMMVLCPVHVRLNRGSQSPVFA